MPSCGSLSDDDDVAMLRSSMQRLAFARYHGRMLNALEASWAAQRKCYLAMTFE